MSRRGPLRLSRVAAYTLVRVVQCTALLKLGTMPLDKGVAPCNECPARHDRLGATNDPSLFPVRLYSSIFRLQLWSTCI